MWDQRKLTLFQLWTPCLDQSWILKYRGLMVEIQTSCLQLWILATPKLKMLPMTTCKIAQETQAFLLKYVEMPLTLAKICYQYIVSQSSGVAFTLCRYNSPSGIAGLKRFMESRNEASHRSTCAALLQRKSKTLESVSHRVTDWRWFGLVWSFLELDFLMLAAKRLHARTTTQCSKSRPCHWWCSWTANLWHKHKATVQKSAKLRRQKRKLCANKCLVWGSKRQSRFAARYWESSSSHKAWAQVPI